MSLSSMNCPPAVELRMVTGRDNCALRVSGHAHHEQRGHSVLLILAACLSEGKKWHKWKAALPSHSFASVLREV